MILNSRQIAIIYEIANREGYSSYKDLVRQFSITEKTLRKDIRTINDVISANNVKILLQKGKGFYLNCSQEEKNRILTSFNYRFDDAFDIENTYTQKNLKIYYLLQRGDFKTEKVASELGTNKNNISRLLVDVRTRLKEYDIRLISRPGRGLNMEGDEINIRNCLIDSMSQISSDEILSVFNDNISLFGISQNEIDNISSICLNIVEKYKISLSRLSIKKLIEAVILTIRRLNNGHCASFDTKQEELIRSFKVNDIVNDFIDQITAYYGLKLPQSEILYLSMYLVLLMDYFDDKYSQDYVSYLQKEALENTEKILQIFEENHICSNQNKAVFYDAIYRACLEVPVRAAFHMTENDFNTAFRRSCLKMPLIMSIASKADAYLKDKYSFNPGDFVLLELALFIYINMKAQASSSEMSKISILTPLDSYSCKSVVSQIRAQCGDYIGDIDVFPLSELSSHDLSSYDLLLYFENTDKIRRINNLKKLRISIEFSPDDLKHLFNILGPIPRYLDTCFARLSSEKQEEWCFDLDDIEQAHDFIRKKICMEDHDLIDQLEALPKDHVFIVNDNYHIVLFTDDPALRKTAVLRLKKPNQIEGRSYSKILINIIFCKDSIITLKASEEIIRRMASISPDLIEKDQRKTGNLLDYYVSDRNAF